VIDVGMLNAVADAISESEACSSCAGTSPFTPHCYQCEQDATAAIRAVLQYQEDHKK
jgi:hypothetical protein